MLGLLWLHFPDDARHWGAATPVCYFLNWFSMTVLHGVSLHETRFWPACNTDSSCSRCCTMVKLLRVWSHFKLWTPTVQLSWPAVCPEFSSTKCHLIDMPPSKCSAAFSEVLYRVHCYWSKMDQVACGLQFKFCLNIVLKKKLDCEGYLRLGYIQKRRGIFTGWQSIVWCVIHLFSSTGLNISIIWHLEHR